MELTKKNKHITLDDLARMTALGFDEVKKEIQGVGNETKGLKNETKGLKNEIDEIKKDVKELMQGQEDIKLRLDNVVYRFELEDVERRVKKLEMKLKIA